MGGMRVVNVPKGVEEKHLKIYFSKPENNGGRIESIYYPLTNNDAVIIFENSKVVDHVLKTDHTLLKAELKLQRLPENMIFSTLEAKLGADVSMLILATPNLQDQIRYAENIEIVEGDHQTLTLRGNWFQLEWAWHMLDCIMQQQELIQNDVTMATSGASRMSDVTPRSGSARDEYQSLQLSSSSSSSRHSARQSPQPASRTSMADQYGSETGAVAAGYDHSHKDKYSSLPVDYLRSSREKNGGNGASSMSSTLRSTLSNGGSTLSNGGSTLSNGVSGSYLDSLKRNIYKGYGAASDDEVDTEDELRGIGYNIPPDSLQNTLSGDYGRPRQSDENATFEKFSSLGFSTDSTGRLSVSSHKHPSDTHSRHETSYDEDTNRFASLPLDLNDRHTDRSHRNRHVDSPDTSNYMTASKYAGHGDERPVTRETTDFSRSLNHSSSTASKYGGLEDERHSTRETKEFSKSLKHSSPTVDVSDQIDAVFQRSLRESVRESNQRIKSPTSNDQPSVYSSQELCFTTYIKGIKVSIYHGSILEEETEAIVNAANEELEHNGGIARAIADARGPEIKVECREYIRKNGNLKTTEAMRTSGGGRIKSANIIHAAGPVWVEQLRDTFIKRLTRTFLNCLKLAETLWLKSISVPAISTGVYGAPLDECVKAYLFAVLLFSQEGRHLSDIRMLNNDAENSVMSIVLMKTLLETGLEDLMSQATALLSPSPSSASRRDLNIPRGRQERSGSVSRMYRKPDDSGATKSASSRRSSSHSRISDRSTSESRDKLLTYTQGDKKRDSFRSSETATSYSPRLPSSEFSTSPSPRGNDRTKGYTTERDQTGNSSDILNRKTLFNRSLSSGQTERSKTSKRPSTAGNISRTAPPIKPSLFSGSVRSKPISQGSRLELSKSPALRSNDPLQAHSPRTTSKSRSRYYNDDDDDDGGAYGVQSLPADLDSESFREKYLRVSSKETAVDVCAICLSEMERPKVLTKCKHKFCTACIDEHFARSKPTCPTCGMIYGLIRGDQPKGDMTYITQRDLLLPGFGHVDGTIVITYTFPAGVQGAAHPNPGQRYKGMERKAYLPNNLEGREVQRLLKKAFEAKLVFTIGSSRTTGKEGVLTWNDIHHKTSISGGPTKYGYPDRDYLKRVKEELAQKGIVSDC